MILLDQEQYNYLMFLYREKSKFNIIEFKGTPKNKLLNAVKLMFIYGFWDYLNMGRIYEGNINSSCFINNSLLHLKGFFIIILL